jgi:hydrogenase large subunit
MSRIVVGPFNRVEGDLEVTLDTARGKVRAAYVNAPLYRGFEQILQGKEPMDALTLAPRICGICSVSQSVAAASALADAMGLEAPANGRLATNLILANENVADHFTHFYLFFMPDFARENYRGRTWFPIVEKRFKAMRGEAASEAAAARAAFLHLMGYLAGKWPHTLSIQPGGSARGVDEAEKARLLVVLRQFRHHLETRTFGTPLESVAALDSEQALDNWRGEGAAGDSDFALFLKVADDLKLAQHGRATDRFLSYGNYPSGEGRMFPPGVWHGGLQALDIQTITEDVSYSWLGGAPAQLPPAEGVTLPQADKEAAYTWCKAPRLGGEVVETGALARQVVDGHPLIRELVATSGGNVRNRVIARLLETARVLIAMEGWARALKPGAPFCHQGNMPAEARGVGLAEAARGSLGHWLHVYKGRILNYQIVSPTTWNFSPRDGQGVPGALEQALVGTPVGQGDEDPVLVQHIVRSFDPCMVCTVH